MSQHNCVQAKDFHGYVLNGRDGKDGVDGKDGIDGKDGVNGVTFTPHLDDEGNLSWTNDGDLENPPTVNLKDGTGSFVEISDEDIDDILNSSASDPDDSTTGDSDGNLDEDYTEITDEEIDDILKS